MINLENISFDHCIKCTVCTAYCPVARATHLYPGPKQSGPDTERLRIKNPNLLDESLKYCNNCKRCEIACPSDVKIADFDKPFISTIKINSAPTIGISIGARVIKFNDSIETLIGSNISVPPVMKL